MFAGFALLGKDIFSLKILLKFPHISFNYIFYLLGGNCTRLTHIDRDDKEGTMLWTGSSREKELPVCQRG
jgi:hypothetical protein